MVATAALSRLLALDVGLRHGREKFTIWIAGTAHVWLKACSARSGDVPRTSLGALGSRDRRPVDLYAAAVKV